MAESATPTPIPALAPAESPWLLSSAPDRFAESEVSEWSPDEADTDWEGVGTGVVSLRTVGMYFDSLYAELITDPEAVQGLRVISGPVANKYPELRLRDIKAKRYRPFISSLLVRAFVVIIPLAFRKRLRKTHGDTIYSVELV